MHMVGCKSTIIQWNSVKLRPVRGELILLVWRATCFIANNSHDQLLAMKGQGRGHSAGEVVGGDPAGLEPIASIAPQ